MPTGASLPLIRLPGFEYPANAKLDFQPLERALTRYQDTQFNLARLERDDQRLGLERERFGLDRERFGLERNRFGLEERRTGFEEERTRLAREEAERQEQERRNVRLGNLAFRYRQISDRTARSAQAIQFIWNTPGLAETLGRHGHRLNREESTVEDYDRALDFIVNQVQDARTRYQPDVVPGAPGTQFYERRIGPGGETRLTPLGGTPERLTPTDRRAIIEADDAVRGARGVQGTLTRALQLNARAYAGPLANQRGWLFQDSNTIMFGNLLTQQVLEQLRATFGGNPTEGERQILLDVSGAANQPREVREEIIRRAIAAARERETAYRQRADQIRSGTFYNPPGQGQTPPPLESTGNVDHDRMRERARAMIQRGEPRSVVIEMLTSRGVPTSGL